MKLKNLNLVRVVAIILFLMIGVTGMLKILEYKRTSILCEQIKQNTYTTTSIGNSITYPMWLSGITSRIFEDSPDIPLVVACQYGNEQAIRDLLQNGADPNWSYPGYFSAIEALYSSPFRGKENRLELAKLLVEHGADVTYHCSSTEAVFKETLRLYGTNTSAEEEQSVSENICFLLDNGANRYDETRGESLLHRVVCYNSALVTKMLIEEFHFDANERSAQNSTPLMLAAKMNHQSLVVYLLSAGADKTLTDENGKTAYDYAVENGYTELAKLLKP